MMSERPKGSPVSRKLPSYCPHGLDFGVHFTESMAGGEIARNPQLSGQVDVPRNVVLAIHAEAKKDRQSKLRFFGIDADEAAFSTHTTSVHFKNYLEVTRTIVQSKKQRPTALAGRLSLLSVRHFAASVRRF